MIMLVRGHTTIQKVTQTAIKCTNEAVDDYYVYDYI